MGTETEAVLAGGGGRLLERYRVQEPKRQVRMGGGWSSGPLLYRGLATVVGDPGEALGSQLSPPGCLV